MTFSGNEILIIFKKSTSIFDVIYNFTPSGSHNHHITSKFQETNN